MDYLCRVGTATGEVVEKTFTAEDEGSLRRDLREQGYFVFSVRSGLWRARFSLRRPRVKTELLYLFCQELAALLKAGLPLLQAVDITLERQKDPLFRSSLAAVRERVQSGTALSEAFREEGEKYPPLLSASLLAGERSGGLEVVLRRLAGHLRLSQALKRKVTVASIYPLAVITFMVALMAIMVVWVIPQFEGFYEGLHAEIPWLTRAILGLSRIVSQNLLAIVVVLLGVAVAFAALWRRPSSRLLVDRALLRLPYFGDLAKMYGTSQLARVLATLLQGGLPLLSALDVAADAVSNRAVGLGIRRAAPLVREGRSLTFALESTLILDPLALEMVRVGEQTGALPDLLGSLAEFLDEDLDVRVATLMSLMEPLILAVLAFGVGVMVLAFYLPLFESFALTEAGR